MAYIPEISAIRFGTGLAAKIAPPASIEVMLERLTKPDLIVTRFPISGFSHTQDLLFEIRALNRSRQDQPEKAQEIKDQIRDIRKKARREQADMLRASMARGIYTEDGFRERLVRFWADHFTVVGKKGVLHYAASSFVEDAIRPNITGKFSEMLKAAMFHPMMLFYLDQVNSVGPKSLAAVRNPDRGINENLAREVLELHTLGVEGGYRQKDVAELAKLFAGLTYRMKRGFIYEPRMAEPGPETVLGKAYGGYIQDLFHVTDFLDDLAVHPDTARHLARKLVVHFVSDDPDAQLVDHVAMEYLKSGGDLMATYRALLRHEAAWAKPAVKVKQPYDFVVSSLRALGVEEQKFTSLNWKKMRSLIIAPMGLMGQMWERPRGPDGWAEEAAHWITPQGLAARIQWAMNVPKVLKPNLPKAPVLAKTALGVGGSAAFLDVVAKSENNPDGVGLVLVSPEFQRR